MMLRSRGVTTPEMFCGPADLVFLSLFLSFLFFFPLLPSVFPNTFQCFSSASSAPFFHSPCPLFCFFSVFTLGSCVAPPAQELTGMMIEKANPLYSRFRLTYQTLLLLSARRDVMTLSSFLSKSFMEASRTSQIPVYRRDLKRKQKVCRAHSLLPWSFPKEAGTERNGRKEEEERRANWRREVKCSLTEVYIQRMVLGDLFFFFSSFCISQGL